MKILGLSLRNILIEFKLEDMWIGLFWKKIMRYQGFYQYDIYICLIPCFPICIRYFIVNKDWKKVCKTIDVEFYLNMVDYYSFK